MRLKTLVIILLLALPFLLSAQSPNQSNSKKEAQNLRSSYITFGGGGNYTSFRDFATSPLFYNGYGGMFHTSIIQSDDQVENEFGFIFTGGNYSNSVGTSYNESFDGSFYWYYSSLYRINSLSSSRLNTKAGGTLNLAMNIRSNNAYMNNGYGSEFIPTLFGSAKTTYDISRKVAKDKNLWFLKFHLNPRKMLLSYQLNAGLINSSYRNGYVYKGQSALLNDWKEYDGYVFNIFSGFRMNSSLDFTYFLHNNNALRLSYLWEAYRTGNEFDKFEFSSHNLSLSLLFNTK